MRLRWWATDNAMVDCVAAPDETSCAHASERLGVILGAYTVYLDLWLCDLQGRVITNGRPDRYVGVRGSNVAQEGWFREARDLASGDDFAVADIARQTLLGDAITATYATAVRAGGRADGAPIGVLAIHFDWEPQARTIVQGVRLNEDERVAPASCWWT